MINLRILYAVIYLLEIKNTVIKNYLIKILYKNIIQYKINL